MTYATKLDKILSERHAATGATATAVVRAVQAAGVRLSAPDLSKMRKGRVIPTLEEAEAIEAFLGVKAFTRTV